MDGTVGDTWITDFRHLLDGNGNLVLEPQRLRLLAQHLCSIVEAVTRRLPYDEDVTTNVWCRRRPKRKACGGKIMATLDDEDRALIVWACPVCGDNGHIRGWQETLWDKRTIL